MPATPVNQLNALPLVTQDNFSVQGDITIVGTTVVKKWLPAASGINGAASNTADPHGGAFAFLMTNWLDLAGCHVVTLNLGVVQNTAEDTQTWTVFFIGAAFVGGSTSPVEPVAFGTPDPRNLTGGYATAYISVGTMIVPNAGITVFPSNKIVTLSVQIGAILGSGVGALGATRIYFRAPTPASANQVAYLTVYGQT